MGTRPRSPINGNRKTTRGVFSLYDPDYTKASLHISPRTLSTRSLRHTSRSDISGASIGNTGLHKKETAVERMRAWEKERQRLRAMAWSEDEGDDNEEQDQEESHAEAEEEQAQDSRLAEERMRQDAERQRLLEEQLVRQEEEEEQRRRAEAEVGEEVRPQDKETKMEGEQGHDTGRYDMAEVEVLQVQRTSDPQYALDMTEARQQETETLAPTPLSPVMEGQRSNSYIDQHTLTVRINRTPRLTI